MSRRWHDHFLRECLVKAHMSKDPSTQVGCVIIGPDRETLSDGFNGFPRGIADAPERLDHRETKLRLMVHAEINAVCNAARIGTSLKGSTLYLACTDHSGQVWGGAPCTRCTVELIQAGIARIVTVPFKPGPSKWGADIAFARQLLAEAGVEYVELERPR
ncbi:MAG TPA: deaminase [Nevskia sp.]|nr:deaminase [Nevskia sp.]